MRTLSILLLPLALAGCVNQEAYESEPVQITTPKGAVLCQFYGVNQVLWDKAVTYANTMTEAEADAYCVEEGKRRLALYRQGQLVEVE